MAKGDIKGRASARAAAAGTSGTRSADMEQRVLAFAEQLGRLAGTLQAKAEASIDRKALNRQIARVRDGASDLLDRLAGEAPEVREKKPARAAARAGTKGRSGGAVDAPGKTHRRRAPADPNAKMAHAQAAKMRTAMPMAKTNRLRGRG